MMDPVLGFLAWTGYWMLMVSFVGLGFVQWQRKDKP